jgi:hypothetical protein
MQPKPRGGFNTVSIQQQIYDASDPDRVLRDLATTLRQAGLTP